MLIICGQRQVLREGACMRILGIRETSIPTTYNSLMVETLHHFIAVDILCSASPPAPCLNIERRFGEESLNKKT